MHFVAVLVLGVDLGVLGSSSSCGHPAGWAFLPTMLFIDHLMLWVLVLICPHSAFGQVIFPYPNSAFSPEHQRLGTDDHQL